MTQDITAFSTSIRLIASATYPTGITITQFSDDADPIDFASIQIGDTAMGVNGELIVWAKAATLPMVLNVIPGSDDDLKLQTLANNNRVSQGRNSVRDIITAVVNYPDGSFTSLSGGKIVNAQFAKSAASSGRLKTKSYAFSFQNVVAA